MKNLFILLAVMSSTLMMAQHSQTRNLESFEEVKLDGRAKIYLKQGTTNKVTIETKKERYLDDYSSEVRNGVLYLKFDNERNNDRKVKIYLTHTGITDLDVDGMIYIETESPISESNLRVKGDGFINGVIDVDVSNLEVDMDGFTSIDVTGRADDTELKLDGFGSIDARDLDSKKIRKDADGLARIRLSSRNKAK